MVVLTGPAGFLPHRCPPLQRHRPHRTKHTHTHVKRKDTVTINPRNLSARVCRSIHHFREAPSSNAAHLTNREPERASPLVLLLLFFSRTRSRCCRSVEKRTQRHGRLGKQKQSSSSIIIISYVRNCMCRCRAQPPPIPYCNTADFLFF